MTAIEVVAETIGHDMNCYSRATNGEVVVPDLCDCAVLDAARDVIAALAGQGEITDEEIVAGLWPDWREYAVDKGKREGWGVWRERRQTENVRALLARQAAVHATRETDWATETNRESLSALVEKYRDGMDAAIARAEAAEAEARVLIRSNTALRATVERVRALCEADDSTVGEGRDVAAEVLEILYGCRYCGHMHDTRCDAFVFADTRCNCEAAPLPAALADPKEKAHEH